MLNRWLSKLERKYWKFAVPRLMSVVLVGMVVIYCFDIIIRFNPDAVSNVSSLFYFDRSKVLHGEVWRVLTFIFLPPDVPVLFAAFAFYFIWLIGIGLEERWGSFRFNVYYFLGIIGNLIVGFCIGYTGNYVLNLSLFLAFAILYPDFEVLLFFFIPVKIKWLALLDALSLVFMLLVGTMEMRLLVLVSVANLLLFFGSDFLYRIKRFVRGLIRRIRIRRH